MNIDDPEEEFWWLPGYKARLKKRALETSPSMCNPETTCRPYKPPVRYKPSRKIGFRRTVRK